MKKFVVGILSLAITSIACAQSNGGCPAALMCDNVDSAVTCRQLPSPETGTWVYSTQGQSPEYTKLTLTLIDTRWIWDTSKTSTECDYQNGSNKVKGVRGINGSGTPDQLQWYPQDYAKNKGIWNMQNPKNWLYIGTCYNGNPCVLSTTPIVPWH